MADVRTEREKMLAGELYDPMGAELNVMAHDIPDRVFAAGKPCRVIRPLEP